MARRPGSCTQLQQALAAFAAATTLLFAGYYSALRVPSCAPALPPGVCPAGCQADVAHPPRPIGPAGVPPAQITKLRKELFDGADPYGLLDTRCGDFATDSKYHDSSTLEVKMVHYVLDLLENPILWVEVGSFIGRSAIKVASEAKKMNLSTSILCADPFTGDTDMWLRHKDELKKGRYNELHSDAFGSPRVYETFLANVRKAGHHDFILPLRSTGIVAMRLLHRMFKEERIKSLPAVVYLDSAREKDETLMELQLAWKVLATPGVLFGSDWGNLAVRGDVIRFAIKLALPSLTLEELHRLGGARTAQPVPGLVVVSYGKGHWVLYKSPAQ
mmetsp:Transcript_105044/g.234451  ORF Transcript_105044/g.234451 Transcript_105044/m.234451 type:complete len:331 (+) Transcript_105044:66-1058(+)